MTIELKTKRLTIRPLHMEYLDSTFVYQGDLELTKYMLFLPDNSREVTEAFIEGLEEEERSAKQRRFEFVLLLGEEHIGGISVYLEQDHGETVGELGWILRKQYWGKGYITEAAEVLLDFSFDKLRLNKVIAHCDARNTASVKVMERIGMTLESIGRRTYQKNGEVAKEYKYSICKQKVSQAEKEEK